MKFLNLSLFLEFHLQQEVVCKRLCTHQNTRLTKTYSLLLGASQVVLVKIDQLPMQEIQETQVQSLGWEDPLKGEMATHSSILA